MEKSNTLINGRETSLEWSENHYYKHYLQTGRFGLHVTIRPFKGMTPLNDKKVFASTIQKLNERKELYFYIFNKLSNDEKIEFKNDFCDKIQRLLDNQTESKYKELLTDYLETINLHYSDYKIVQLTPTTATGTKTTNVSDLIQGTNQNATNFFYYLFEKYRPNENKSVVFCNIWHFLKYDSDKINFTFKTTQTNYKEFVLRKYSKEIKKFAKNELYNEGEKPILHSHENAFLKTLTP